MRLDTLRCTGRAPAAQPTQTYREHKPRPVACEVLQSLERGGPTFTQV
jgi:hypothetical protein